MSLGPGQGARPADLRGPGREFFFSGPGHYDGFIILLLLDRYGRECPSKQEAAELSGPGAVPWWIRGRMGSAVLYVQRRSGRPGVYGRIRTQPSTAEGRVRRTCNWPRRSITTITTRHPCTLFGWVILAGLKPSQPSSRSAVTPLTVISVISVCRSSLRSPDG